MSNIRDAHEAYTVQTILHRVQEENERADDSFNTLKQSTDRLKASLETQQSINDSLDESRSRLFHIKLTALSEDLLFRSGLIFYVCVICYIILSRTLFAWFFSK